MEEKDSMSIEKRKEQVIDLYNTTNLTQQEIAKRLNVTRETINKDIKELRKEGKINIKREKIVTPEDIKKILKKGVFTRYTDKKFTKYMLNCKRRLEKGTLEKEELEIIQLVARRTNKYAHVLLYVKASIHFNKIKEAKFFINTNLNNESFTPEQKIKMKDLKVQVDILSKKRDAWRILKEGKGVKAAASYSGLLETEVVKLNRMMLEKKNSEGKENESEYRE